jgi:hypothetical protein
MSEVKLEVLDRGGNGRAVVLLAGYQTTHEYDDFASKLAAFCAFMESQDGDSALPLDHIQATPRSGQQKTFCKFSTR